MLKHVNLFINRALVFFYKYVGPAFCVTDLKIDMKVVDVGARPMSWAGIASDRIRWMSALKKHLDIAREGKLMTVAAAGKRAF